MAFYVNVPKDLSKVKNKVAFNLTRRQIICFGLAVVTGFPFYFLTRNIIGNSNAATAMVLLMVPAFVFAMYEKDGLPLEKVLGNYIRVRYLRPQIRRYETANMTKAGSFVRADKSRNNESSATGVKQVNMIKKPGKGGAAYDRTRERKEVCSMGIS